MSKSTLSKQSTIDIDPKLLDQIDRIGNLSHARVVGNGACMNPILFSSQKHNMFLFRIFERVLTFYYKIRN